MQRPQIDVQEFHEALDIPVGEGPPQIRRPELRAALIAEEARETLEGITGHVWHIDQGMPLPVEQGASLVESIDGMCDLIVVTYGAAVEFGVDLEPHWDEVHRANMAKVGGPVRGDGKRLKPEGWTPPDHWPILGAQGNRPAGAKPLKIVGRP